MAWKKTKPEFGGFELLESQVPKPKQGEVLVKTHSTSICGTDLHIWKWDDWAAENVPPGTITGHETCGTVVGIGDGVSTHEIGDKIAVECHLACFQFLSLLCHLIDTRSGLMKILAHEILKDLIKN